MIENWESPQSASISNHKKSGNNEDDFRSKFLRSHSASLLSHKKSTNGEDFCSKFVRWDILTTESIKFLLRRNNIYNHKMYIYLYYIFLHDFITTTMLQNLKDQTWHKNPSKNLGFCRYIHTWILSHKLRYQENMLQKESNRIPDEFKSNFQTAYYMYNIRSKCLYFCNISVS